MAGTTISDVAREAGVSTATVSRCLNGSGAVSADARARVEAAVARLGYIPDLGARALASRRSRVVGAVVPTLENSIFARALQAFQSELARRDATLLLASSDYDPAEEARQIEALVARGIGGLLLIGAGGGAAEPLLRARAIPVVRAWSAGPGASVGFDNAAAMEGLAAEVIGRGHERIAMIAGRTEGNDRAAARVAGLRRAADAAGLPEPEVIECPYALEPAGDALEALLPSRPTAILCGNDVLGVGALLRARALGLDVPGDVAVTGFDDIELARVCAPGLTTVHVPHARMGARSAEVLIDLMEGHETRAEALPTRIVWRGSCP